MSIGFGRVVWVWNINLEVVFVYMLFKVMRLKEIIKGVGVDGEERSKDLVLRYFNVKRLEIG